MQSAGFNPSGRLTRYSSWSLFRSGPAPNRWQYDFQPQTHWLFETNVDGFIACCIARHFMLRQPLPLPTTAKSTWQLGREDVLNRHQSSHYPKW
jgi:hypothetical protein